MNVHEILTANLKAISADGLDGEECDCGIDDLMPCSDWSGCGDCKECKPAKKVIATEAGECGEIGETIYQEIKQ